MLYAIVKFENKIKKRVEELKKIKKGCSSGSAKSKYNFAIAELNFLL